MTNLLILGDTTDLSIYPEYRGTDRPEPYHVDNLDDNHPVNRAFFLLLHMTNEDGLLHDLAKAREIVEAYKTLTPSQIYEIIEVTENKEPPMNSEALFLGYDLSCDLSDSLISLVLIAKHRLSDKQLEEEGISRPVILFHRLIIENFRPKLNKNLLFDDYETASFCLDCMMSILSIEPQFYEPGEYKVVGIYKVT
jgi:hypothetical protein